MWPVETHAHEASDTFTEVLLLLDVPIRGTREGAVELWYDRV